jgi:SWI/SNF-related matrix-associated actin-dependent regulator of chromatin subfamily A-like protein 1
MAEKRKRKPKPMFCPQCLEERKVVAVIGKMRRLECKHLIVTHLTEEEELEVAEEIAEDIAEYKPLAPATIFDVTQFHNLKTKDTPYPFQLKGIEFAIQHAFRCLIADEQGLGKTVQALGILHYAMKHCPELVFPCLIFAKSNVKMQWMVQILNWCGVNFIPQVVEDSKNPPVLGFNICIASYDILRRFSKIEEVEIESKWGHKINTTRKENPFYDFPFKTVIMDEVQAIKGDSQRTEEVKRVCEGKNVIALSGTPIKNNADEYFTILHILNPAKFPSRKHYRNYWVKSEVINGYEKFTGIRYPKEFAEFTADMIIRRTRDEVKDEIGMRVTKANRIFYHVDFESDKLKAAYLQAEALFIREMEAKAEKKSNSVELIARLSVLRHLVGLNKIQPTVDLAVEFLLENPSGKLVIFAHHEDVMKSISLLLSNWCIEGGYPVPLIYHSGLNQEERFAMVAKFAEGKHPFIIGSTLAMGEGVDRLQEVCNDCIIAERQWNPANEEQAESRLVRIGQKRSFVNATYPIASNTIDEYFTEIVETKRRSMKETLDGVENTWDETGLLTALYDAILLKGRKKLKKGW